MSEDLCPVLLYIISFFPWISLEGLLFFTHFLRRKTSNSEGIDLGYNEGGRRDWEERRDGKVKVEYNI